MRPVGPRSSFLQTPQCVISVTAASPENIIALLPAVTPALSSPQFHALLPAIVPFRSVRPHLSAVFATAVFVPIFHPARGFCSAVSSNNIPAVLVKIPPWSLPCVRPQPQCLHRPVARRLHLNSLRSASRLLSAKMQLIPRRSRRLRLLTGARRDFAMGLSTAGRTDRSGQQGHKRRE